MPDRDSDERSVAKPRGRPFKPGTPKPPNSGRKKGTPNKATRAAKQWLAEIIERTDVQDAVRRRILKGDTAAFFRALEHVIGKPRQAVEVSQDSSVVFRWAGEVEGREGRRRVAEARGTEAGDLERPASSLTPTGAQRAGKTS